MRHPSLASRPQVILSPTWMMGGSGKRSQLCGCVQAKRTLREVDINGDGRISKEEFHHMLTGSPVPDSLDQYDARVFLEH